MRGGSCPSGSHAYEISERRSGGVPAGGRPDGHQSVSSRTPSGSRPASPRSTSSSTTATGPERPPSSPDRRASARRSWHCTSCSTVPPTGSRASWPRCRNREPLLERIVARVRMDDRHPRDPHLRPLTGRSARRRVDAPSPRPGRGDRRPTTRRRLHRRSRSSPPRDQRALPRVHVLTDPALRPTTDQPADDARDPRAHRTHTALRTRPLHLSDNVVLLQYEPDDRHAATAPSPC